MCHYYLLLDLSDQPGEGNWAWVEGAGYGTGQQTGQWPLYSARQCNSIATLVSAGCSEGSWIYRRQDAVEVDEKVDSEGK